MQLNTAVFDFAQTLQNRSFGVYAPLARVRRWLLQPFVRDRVPKKTALNNKFRR